MDYSANDELFRTKSELAAGNKPLESILASNSSLDLSVFV